MFILTKSFSYVNILLILVSVTIIRPKEKIFYMWNGKMKALTFSYDDGVLQDKKLVDIFNKYSLKCTFNINSGMLYNECIWTTRGVDVIRMTADECINTFRGHEKAVHSLTHPALSDENDYMLEREIAGDKANIEYIFGEKVYGMALPGGITDNRIEAICKRFNIHYVRNIRQSNSFDIPSDLYNLSPTAHHNNENLFELGEKFIKMKPNKPQLFYIWGHSYEFDVNQNWDMIDNFCKMISGHDDIFYCTNTEALEPFFKI